MTNNLDLNADIIDVRDIIARFEELEAELFNEDGEIPESLQDSEEVGEYKLLKNILEDQLDGNGGDEEWRGSWYPVTLIADDHFQDYAEELANDIGAIVDNAKWPNNCIDWEKAARELQYDYTSVDIDGETYWTR